MKLCKLDKKRLDILSKIDNIEDFVTYAIYVGRLDSDFRDKAIHHGKVMKKITEYFRNLPTNFGKLREECMKLSHDETIIREIEEKYSK